MGKLDVRKIAQMCNGRYYATRGDRSLEAWFLTHENFFGNGMMGFLYYQQNPGKTPEDFHQYLAEGKKEDGWTLGKVEDKKAKTHPYLVLDYNDLPDDVREKEDIFCSAIKSILEGVTP